MMIIILYSLTSILGTIPQWLQVLAIIGVGCFITNKWGKYNKLASDRSYKISLKEEIKCCIKGLRMIESFIIYRPPLLGPCGNNEKKEIKSEFWKLWSEVRPMMELNTVVLPKELRKEIMDHIDGFHHYYLDAWLLDDTYINMSKEQEQEKRKTLYETQRKIMCVVPLIDKLISIYDRNTM